MDEIKRKDDGLNKEDNVEVKKLSETILEFAEPITSVYNNLKTQQNILIFAIMAWNASMLPRELRLKEKKNILKKVNSEDKQMKSKFSDTIDFLIKRKNEKFKEDKRVVYDYKIDINESQNKIILSVMSSPLKK